MNSPQKRLEELGLQLPTASAPAARYANIVQIDRLIFVAGKGPKQPDGTSPSGKLGQEFNTEEGYEFARLTGLQILAVLHDHFGTLDAVTHVVKLQGFVNATPDFTEHHKVLNGCSDLMVEIFGETGSHARSVLGAVSLRDNLPIVVDSIFESASARSMR
jgi:enamine deaminase RidA (YjgF/YER057c/UK114 family)